MTSDPSSPAETPPPYRIWAGVTTFRRNGTPVLGTMGASAEPVVVMTQETFQRLSRHPALADAQWELAHV